MEIDGACVEYDLQSGQSIIVDMGHLAAMSSSCHMEVVKTGGVKNALLGGEGLFNTEITGPGHVWLQTMPIPNVANALMPYFPTEHDD